MVLENRGVSSLVPFHSHHRDHQLPGQLELKQPFSVGWRDGSVLKSTCHSCKGPRSNSRHPHGGSQLSLTAVFINPGEGWANARLSPRTWCIEKEPGIYLAALVMAWGQARRALWFLILRNQFIGLCGSIMFLTYCVPPCAILLD